MGAASNQMSTTDYADDADNLFISSPEAFYGNQTEGSEGNEESVDVESGNQEIRKFSKRRGVSDSDNSSAVRTRSARSHVRLQNFPSRRKG